MFLLSNIHCTKKTPQNVSDTIIIAYTSRSFLTSFHSESCHLSAYYAVIYSTKYTLLKKKKTTGIYGEEVMGGNILESMIIKHINLH